MRLGLVIGRVTLSQVIPELNGARWLVVSPLNRGDLQRGANPANGLGSEPSLVVYDNLGGGVGDLIGFVEGREAAQPLQPPAAVDAIVAALVDCVNFFP